LSPKVRRIPVRVSRRVGGPAHTAQSPAQRRQGEGRAPGSGVVLAQDATSAVMPTYDSPYKCTHPSSGRTLHRFGNDAEAARCLLTCTPRRLPAPGAHTETKVRDHFQARPNTSPTPGSGASCRVSRARLPAPRWKEGEHCRRHDPRTTAVDAPSQSLAFDHLMLFRRSDCPLGEQRRDRKPAQAPALRVPPPERYLWSFTVSHG
jgi:hypothetical protein